MRPHLTTSIAAIAAAVILAGCATDNAAPSDIPSGIVDGPSVAAEASVAVESASPSNVHQNAPATTAEQTAVLAAYKGFYTALGKVRVNSSVPVRSTLAPYTTGRQLEFTTKATLQQRKDGITGYGTTALHPRAPQVKGRTATIQDCQDTSQVGTKYVKSGKIRSWGYNLDSATTTLVKGKDGRWRVSDTKFAPDNAAFCDRSS